MDNIKSKQQSYDIDYMLNLILYIVVGNILISQLAYNDQVIRLLPGDQYTCLAIHGIYRSSGQQLAPSSCPTSPGRCRWPGYHRSYHRSCPHTAGRLGSCPPGGCRSCRTCPRSWRHGCWSDGNRGTQSLQCTCSNECEQKIYRRVRVGRNYILIIFLIKGSNNIIIIGPVKKGANHVPKEVSDHDPLSEWVRDLNYVRSQALRPPSRSRTGFAHCEVMYCSYCAD